MSNIKDRTLEYLRLLRLQTGAATASAPLIGGLIMNERDLLILSVLFLIGILYHIFGFVLNEYIDIEVDNRTLEIDGNPTVTFTSNTIRLDYTGGGVNITLGSGVNYTLDITTTAGGVAVTIGDGAHVGDVSINVASGGIAFTLTSDAQIMGNASVDLTADSGGIAFTIDPPAGVEARVDVSVVSGGVDIDAVGWVSLGNNDYQTNNYDSGAQILDISVSAVSGGIAGTLI